MSRRRAGHGPLRRLLRDEAARDRPVFDRRVHTRILGAVRRRVAAGVGRDRLAGRFGRLATLAAGVAIASVAVAPRGDRRPGGNVAGLPPATRVAAAADLDSLPTFAEIGDELAAGIGSLAAAAVGLPDWPDLAVADLLVLVGTPPEDGMDRAGGPHGGSARVRPVR